MEEVFHFISSEFVTVKKGRFKCNDSIVKSIVTEVTEEMRNESPLFRMMFETHLYAGSVYDGLKVGKPDEYDIDFKLFLPKKLNVQVIPSDKPGFVYLYLKGWKNLNKDRDLNKKYGELEEFMTEDHYLLQSEIKNWMESIVTRALNKIEEYGGFRHGDIRNVTYKMSGPAVTLNVETNNNKKIDIDLVAVFRIPGDKWLKPPYRQNFSRKKMHYLVVPKPPKAYDPDDFLDEDSEIYWRLSFPEQEMEYLNNCYTLKPVLRFIKKLRDKHHPNISSYIIKTIFLWKVRDERNDKSFWQRSFVDVLIDMLEIYSDCMDDHNIKYFWNSGHNLLESYHEDNTADISNFLDRMIADIINSRDTNPLILAEYLLPPEEYERVQNKFHGRF